MICKHNKLIFVDQGTRIRCGNDKCSRSWYRETAPGSCMPFLGLVPIEEMIDSMETRENPFAVKKIEGLPLNQKPAILGKNEPILQLHDPSQSPPKPGFRLNSGSLREKGGRARGQSPNGNGPRDLSGKLANLPVSKKERANSHNRMSSPRTGNSYHKRNEEGGGD